MPLGALPYFRPLWKQTLRKQTQVCPFCGKPLSAFKNSAITAFLQRLFSDFRADGGMMPHAQEAV